MQIALEIKAVCQLKQKTAQHNAEPRWRLGKEQALDLLPKGSSCSACRRWAAPILVALKCRSPRREGLEASGLWGALCWSLCR